jgi:hypothetical protein
MLDRPAQGMAGRQIGLAGVRMSGWVQFASVCDRECSASAGDNQAGSSRRTARHRCYPIRKSGKKNAGDIRSRGKYCYLTPRTLQVFGDHLTLPDFPNDCFGITRFRMNSARTKSTFVLNSAGRVELEGS